MVFPFEFPVSLGGGMFGRRAHYCEETTITAKRSTQRDNDTQQPGHGISAQRSAVRTAARVGGALAAESDATARGMGGAHHRNAPAHRDDQGRDLRGSNLGVRQLR